MFPNHTLPVLDHEGLDPPVKKPEFTSRKSVKQVTMEISKALAQAQLGCISPFLWDHTAQHFSP